MRLRDAHGVESRSIVVVKNAHNGALSKGKSIPLTWCSESLAARDIIVGLGIDGHVDSGWKR
jgi:hypothetical protein